jgi:hypothetical protein
MVTASHISNMQPIPPAAYLQASGHVWECSVTTEAVQMTVLTSVTARISPSTHSRATGQSVTGTNVSPLNVFLHYPPTAQHNSC